MSNPLRAAQGVASKLLMSWAPLRASNPDISDMELVAWLVSRLVVRSRASMWELPPFLVWASNVETQLRQGRPWAVVLTASLPALVQAVASVQGPPRSPAPSLAEAFDTLMEELRAVDFRVNDWRDAYGTGNQRPGG